MDNAISFETAFKNVPTTGWLTQEEAALLWHGLRPTGFFGFCRRRVLEVGCYFGRSASLISQAIQHIPTARLWLCDPFMDEHHFYSDSPGSQMAAVRSILDEVAKAGMATRTHLCVMPDRELALRWTSNWDSKLDLVYLDGDHSYEGTYWSIRDWHKHLDPINGIMMLHDYCNEGGGALIKRAIEDSSDIIDLLQVSSRMAMCRPKVVKS